MPVYLYLIAQKGTDGFSYDCYSSAVVSAHSAEEASHVHPNRFVLLWGEDNCEEEWRDERSWVTHPREVEVEYLGVADSSIPNNSVILTSFHSG